MNQATNIQPQNNRHQRLPNIGGSQRTQRTQRGNPFGGLRSSDTPIQNAEFQTVLFWGFSFT
ncbi:14640_t:CDS:2 [Dentiscutata erythropus]|uniref:14640_t:CDS:1 n=1 Tax=Dentiscutata erythropus TaxID=1348616 RepID=A0A9N8VVR8_9GLOM|nr:14640_t:CDS:2 [Dentiscutata erythropus]